MLNVCHDANFPAARIPETAQHGGQAAGDPHGHGDRDAASDTDQIYALDAGYPSDYPFELRIAQGKGISPRNQHFTNRAVGFNPSARSFDIVP